MTIFYKGNNIGLSYNAAAGTWSFNNTPQDFIDPNAFSTPDPKFPTAPTTPTDPSDPTPDPCPPGYVYDETLKQCVPDPNYQNPFRQDTQGGGTTNPPVKIAGTDRYTTDNNFIATDAEYENMTAEEFVENYKQRGMVGKDKNGNDIYMKDIWPSNKEIEETLKKSLNAEILTTEKDYMRIGENFQKEINLNLNEIKR